MLEKEGQVRIPAGCAISGFISRDGNRICGDKIVKSISYMHDRSNGLGGGFAGYGIYPEYKDQYAFHIFYDSNEARVETERFLDKHFDVVNLSRIPTRKHPNITNEPLIWRYFVRLPARRNRSTMYHAQAADFQARVLQVKRYSQEARSDIHLPNGAL